VAPFSVSDLDVSPLLLGTFASVAALIGADQVAARRRGIPAAGQRLLLGLTGVALLGVAFVSPLAPLAAHYLLTGHLVQVTLVMGFVPPLLLLAMRPRRRPTAAVPRWLGRCGAHLVHPAVAIVLVNVVFFGWHAPALYQACLEHSELYSLQQVTLLAVSVLFWWPIVEPGGGRWSLGPLAKLGYILLATVPQTFAGLVFALAHSPFYRGYVSGAPAAGMNPLTDQQIAGACMALISKLALFIAFSVVFWRLLDPHTADGDLGDDGGPDDDRGDAPLPVTPRAPAWLGMLDRGPVTDEPSPQRREPVPSRREPAPSR
jgi:cytochrome c oxidase assembly factor CtaG